MLHETEREIMLRRARDLNRKTQDMFGYLIESRNSYIFGNVWDDALKEPTGALCYLRAQQFHNVMAVKAAQIEADRLEATIQ